MRDFYLRLIGQHDLWMSGVALVICVLGTYATSTLGRQAAAASARRARVRWLLLGILALTFSIWSSSFIAMLGARVVMPSGFAPESMIASFIAAFVLVGLGATVTLTGRFPYAAAFGGAIAGLAISVMHYIGMSGFRVVGTIE